MLHRKQTLEYLQQPHTKLTPTELKEQLKLAIQLASEQQEYIEKLAKSIGCARKAAKGNLVGLERAKKFAFEKQVQYERLHQKYEKLLGTMFDLEQSLRKMGFQFVNKSIKEMVDEYRLKSDFEKELLK